MKSIKSPLCYQTHCQTRRQLILGSFVVSCGGLAALFGQSALAQLSGNEATLGLKGALEEGARKAVSRLGTKDGFLLNKQVRIPLPEPLRKVRSAAKLLGMDKQFVDLEVSMNRAAEAAVPNAKSLLQNAIKAMTVDDALKILKGGDDSVTQYFKAKTQPQLVTQFQPFSREAVDKVGLTKQYETLAAKGSSLGLVKPEQADLATYVSQKAVDGLFHLIAEEERALRKNPLGAANDVVRRVFGLLK